MEYLLSIIVFVAILWTLAYWKVAMPASVMVFASALVAWTAIASSHPLLKVFVWTVFLSISVPLSIKSLRKKFLTHKIFLLFKNFTPKISNTEREALEAGGVWWDGELFSGAPNWKKLHSFKKPDLTKEEREFLNGPVEKLCKMIDDLEISEVHHDLSPQVWVYIKKERFFGMIIPKQYGGLGFSALAHSEIVMKIASKSLATAVTVMVPNSLGPAELLLHYGTDDQKSSYLPGLADGTQIPCFALTGPEAGSDAASIPDTGVVVQEDFQGSKVLGIRLNFEKRYITLAPKATVIGLAFKLYDPELLLGKNKDIGITVALIPASTPGVETGKRHNPLNVAFMNGPVRGKDVFIPLDWVVGGRGRVGQGWKMLMERLAVGRSISLPALSVAAAKHSSRYTGAYSRIRKQFKTPIGKFEGISEKLASMAATTYMMDSARLMTVGAVDDGESPSVVSAIVKYNLTESMRSVVNDAMDIQAGSGISMGPRNITSAAYTSLPIGITVEGANILTRSLIVFGQGAIRCHPHVLDEMKAANEPDFEWALEAFDSAFFSHIGFTMSNAARALFHGLTGSIIVFAPRSPLFRYYQMLSRYSAAFALTADMAMATLGPALKKKERLSGRLADVLSQMYMASSTLKKFRDDNNPEADLPMARWALEKSLYEIERNLNEVFDNLPVRPAGWLLKVLVFPFGARAAMPSDYLGESVAAILLENSKTRDRLTMGIYIPKGLNERRGVLEDALIKVMQAEPLEKKLALAIKDGSLRVSESKDILDEAVKAGVLTDEERHIVEHAMEARTEVITVDEFPFDHWSDGKWKAKSETKAA